MEFLRSEANRLRTFQLNPPWPLEFIDTKKLARAGFFYYSIDDRVQCVFCNQVISHWERGDDPLLEHARYSPRCPFINGQDVGNIPIDDDPIPGPKRIRSYDEFGLRHVPAPQPTNPQSLNRRIMPSNNSATATIPTHTPNQINSNNPQLGICKICYTNEVGYTFIPCGHGVVCLSCASCLGDSCPMCRTPIQQRIRLFLA